MGFMGFGMQKWIYTMRPRKPFSMQRKGSFTVIPTYSRTFKLQKSKNNSGFNFGILLFIISAIIIGLMLPRYLDNARLKHEQEVTHMISKDNKAFSFLMISGKRRLNRGKLSEAHSEFKLAHAIKPNNKEVNQLLLETLSKLCFEYNKNCNELDNLQL